MHYAGVFTMQTSRIFKRGETYYYRRRIPQALRKNKSHSFIISLKTSDVNSAQRIAICYDLHFDKIIIQAKLQHMKIDTNNIFELTMKFNADGSREITMTEEEFRNASPEQLAALNGNVRQVTEIKDTKNYPTISEAIEEYKKDRERRNKPLRDKKTPAHFRRIIELTKDIRIDKFNHDAKDFVVDKLKLMPARPELFKNQTVWEILNEDYEEYIMTKTLNDHMSTYSTFFDFALQKYELKVNQFKGYKIQESDENKKAKDELRLNFNRSALKKVFSQKRFTLGSYDKEYEFWCPLIGLHTGARLNEIAQLRTYDIKKSDDGVYYFDFTTLTEDHDEQPKKLKNPGSKRKTPIHKNLIDIGLIDYWQKRKSENQLFMFDDLGPYDKDNGFGRYPGESFSKFCKSVDVEQTFHSLRGFVCTELRNAGVQKLERFYLTGRETGYKDTEDSYYIERTGLKNLQIEINKLNFDEIIKDAYYNKS